MSGYNKENFQNGITDYSYIGLMSKRINIGIIGGGRAAYIKASHFLKDNCKVEIMSLEFSDDVKNLKKEYIYTLKLIKKEFSVDFLKNKHIIIAAVNDEGIIKEVERFCCQNYRIFINCVDHQQGMGIIPFQIKGDNIIACVNSVSANPKGTIMIGREVKKIVNKYDDFIGFASIVRNRAKTISKYKKTIMDIIGRKEFEEYYNKGMAEEYLKRYLNEDMVEFLMDTQQNINSMEEE